MLLSMRMEHLSMRHDWTESFQDLAHFLIHNHAVLRTGNYFFLHTQHQHPDENFQTSVV